MPSAWHLAEKESPYTPFVAAISPPASEALAEMIHDDPPGQYGHSYPQRDRKRTLWLFNIAMENGPFIDGLPIKNGDFPWLC
jgi:hypothetical protein